MNIKKQLSTNLFFCMIIIMISFILLSNSRPELFEKAEQRIIETRLTNYNFMESKGFTEDKAILDNERTDKVLDANILLMVIALVFLFTSRSKIQTGVMPAILGIALLLFNRYLLIFHLVWHETVYSLFAILVSYIVALIISQIKSKYDSEVSELPLTELLKLSTESTEEQNVEIYIKSIEKNVINVSNLKLIECDITENNPVYKNTILESEEKNGYLQNKKLIFIKIPSLSSNNEKHYCVLGKNMATQRENIRHVSALITSADVYIKSQKDGKLREQLFRSIIESMVAVIDSKDPITAGHSKRVAKISKRIGELLKMDKEELELLEFSATIHDIGKIGISDSVLNKPCFFSNADFDEMKQHPENGNKIMDTIKINDEFMAGIYQHHERIDGKGYPNGLVGDEIKLFAKIIKIADVYDALISERQYKKGWELSKVCNLLYEGKGLEFDSKIVDLFLEDIKPINWVYPNKKEENKNNNYDKYIDVSKFIQKICMENSLVIKNEDSINNSFDFTCKNKLFNNLEFGNPFWDNNFAYNVNNKIYTNEEDKIICYLGKNENSNSKILYYFKRGYLNAGSVSSGIGENKLDLKQLLANSLNEPIFVDIDMEIWDLGFSFAILLLGDIEDFVVYVHKAI